jgi:nicotinamidase-related amidase
VPIKPEILTNVGLVINEVQNSMTNPEFASNAPLANDCTERGVIKNIARLAEVCRGLGVPVIYNNIVMREDKWGASATCLLLGSLRKKAGVTIGSPGAANHPDVAPAPGDYVIERLNGLTAFHGTNLESICRAEGITTLIFTGVSTNIGIPGNCLEAVNRSMYAVVPEDCIGAAFPEAQAFQVTHTLPLLATVTNADELIAALQAVNATSTSA